MRQFTIKAFAEEYDYSLEYVRQCCRNQTIGRRRSAAQLPPGFRAAKRGGRWIIEIDENIWQVSTEASPKISETACIEMLLTHWHYAALAQTRRHFRGNSEGWTLALTPKPKASIIKTLKMAYITCVIEGPVIGEFNFARGEQGSGSFQISFEGPDPHVLEALLPRRGKELRQRFIVAWVSEFNQAQQKKARKHIMNQPHTMKATKQGKVDFDKRCLNCGKLSKKLFHNKLCHDAHRKWIRRIASLTDPEEIERLLSERYERNVLPNLRLADFS